MFSKYSRVTTQTSYIETAAHPPTDGPGSVPLSPDGVSSSQAPVHIAMGVGRGRWSRPGPGSEPEPCPCTVAWGKPFYHLDSISSPVK